jgi:hypothetical protein
VSRIGAKYARAKRKAEAEHRRAAREAQRPEPFALSIARADREHLERANVRGRTAIVALLVLVAVVLWISVVIGGRS